jgi:hypothetical protein
MQKKMPTRQTEAPQLDSTVIRRPRKMKALEVQIAWEYIQWFTFYGHRRTPL